jgi:hypothetical protein
MTTIDFNPQLPILYATLPEAAFAETSEVGDGAQLDRGEHGRLSLELQVISDLRKLYA